MPLPKVSKAFDFKKRVEVEPDFDVVGMIEKFPDEDGFSLQSVFESIGGKGEVDSTAEINADAVISKDLIAQDVSRLDFFRYFTYFMSIVGTGLLIASCLYFAFVHRSARSDSQGNSDDR